jgi:hypothetical protein
MPLPQPSQPRALAGFLCAIGSDPLLAVGTIRNSDNPNVQCSPAPLFMAPCRETVERKKSLGVAKSVARHFCKPQFA